MISQAKLVVSEILEPSPQNEYAHAVASLPAVQDLCFSVFGGGGGCAALPPYTTAAAGSVPGTTAETVGAGASSLRDVGRMGAGGAVANGFGAAAAVRDGDCDGDGDGDGGLAGGPPRASRQRAR